MPLKWLIVIPALFIGAAIVSWIGWGFWAAYPFAHAIIAFGVAALIMLWIRFSWRSSPRRIEDDPAGSEDEPFMGYPKDHVLGILDHEEEASAARDEFARAGFDLSGLTVLSGRQGAAQIDADGAAHGAAEQTERAVERLFADIDDLRRYDEAVRAGSYVIAMEATDEDARVQVAEIIKRHGAHDVHYFGSMVVQDMNADPARIRGEGGTA